MWLLRLVAGLAAVALLQVVSSLGVVYASRTWSAGFLTLLVPVFVFLAGVAYFRIATGATGRKAVGISMAILASELSTYLTMFVLLNAYGS